MQNSDNCVKGSFQLRVRNRPPLCKEETTKIWANHVKTKLHRNLFTRDRLSILMCRLGPMEFYESLKTYISKGSGGSFGEFLGTQSKCTKKLTQNKLLRNYFGVTATILSHFTTHCFQLLHPWSGKNDPVQFKGVLKQNPFCLQKWAFCKQFSPLRYRTFISLEKDKFVLQKSLSETPFFNYYIHILIFFELIRIRHYITVTLQ